MNRETVMLSPMGNINPAERVAFVLRGGAFAQSGGGVPVSRPRDSISAADLKIPGAGGSGIRLQPDEYIPSFPAPSPPFPALPRADEPRKAVDDRDVRQDDAQETDDASMGAAAEQDQKEKTDTGELTDEELRIVTQLQARDREVRAHEQAHISAGGAYIRGAATYEYENGPDNKRYAVGGEVGIDSSPVSGNPEATIAKMQVVRSAALAPAEPSGQDRAVAAAASRHEANARVELREMRAAEAEEAAGTREAQNAGDRGDNDSNAADKPPSRIVADAISAYSKSSATTMNMGGINFAA